MKLVNEWFLANKLSLKCKKKKKKKKKKKTIKFTIENLTKFLGVIIDENLTCKNYIEVTENKISKNIGNLYGLVIHLISET